MKSSIMLVQKAKAYIHTLNHDLLFPTATNCVVDQSNSAYSAERLSPIAHSPISSQDLQVFGVMFSWCSMICHCVTVFFWNEYISSSFKGVFFPSQCQPSNSLEDKAQRHRTPNLYLTTTEQKKSFLALCCCCCCWLFAAVVAVVGSTWSPCLFAMTFFRPFRGGFRPTAASQMWTALRLRIIHLPQ